MNLETETLWWDQIQSWLNLHQINKMILRVLRETLTYKWTILTQVYIIRHKFQSNRSFHHRRAGTKHKWQCLTPQLTLIYLCIKTPVCSMQVPRLVKTLDLQIIFLLQQVLNHCSSRVLTEKLTCIKVKRIGGQDTNLITSKSWARRLQLDRQENAKISSVTKVILHMNSSRRQALLLVLMVKCSSRTVVKIQWAIQQVGVEQGQVWQVSHNRDLIEGLIVIN